MVNELRGGFPDKMEPGGALTGNEDAKCFQGSWRVLRKGNYENFVKKLATGLF